MARTRALLATAALVLTAGLAACSGDDAPAPGDPTVTARAKPRPPARPARLVREGPPVEVRVLQYNIQFADAGIDGVVDDIRAADADIVLLNEIDDRRSTGGLLQPRYLARKLGMNVAFDPNGTVRHGVRGNAVLTSFDIAYVRRFDLPTPDGTEKRGLMDVVVRQGDVQLDVWTTHLNPDVGTLAQARRVRTIIGEPACTTVLAGDLNVKPYRNPPTLLREHLGDVWRYVGDGAGGTNRAGNRRIDYMYFARAEPVSAEVRPRGSSDHRGLLGTFSVDPDDNC
ncbi:endonuclease/exonuclease/phosphatase family protein [Nocardioides sp.]|uniref:endonuclease/exonuclease/phosphatase family protein n=1 Tax=Nocardioides sp. TaxID=35761 RepID=UPI0027203EDE|nr:endonuclease/exonuclease/phosphatase family protein [Nocardioides sp.]MDO9454748.1 endonuclease/exonuclease/phosphatase family protein [Nocardioides sp.]